MSTKEVPASERGNCVAARRLFNDSVAEGAQGFDSDESFEFLCECGYSDCDEVVVLTVAQYRVARFWPIVAHGTSRAAYNADPETCRR